MFFLHRDLPGGEWREKSRGLLVRRDEEGSAGWNPLLDPPLDEFWTGIPV